MLINQAQVALDQTEGHTEDEIMRIENQYWVDLYNALERLEKNDDFRRVILDGYFKDKAINGVSLLATDYVKKNGLRGDIMEQLVAVAQLQDYFITIKSLGSNTSDEVDGEEN